MSTNYFSLMRVIYSSQNFVESLHGTQCCTPNMHMACHLKDCLLDFSPFFSFPYERILEGVSMSWILPEKQMFMTCQTVEYIEMP